MRDDDVEYAGFDITTGITAIEGQVGRRGERTYQVTFPTLMPIEILR